MKLSSQGLLLSTAEVFTVRLLLNKSTKTMFLPYTHGKQLKTCKVKSVGSLLHRSYVFSVIKK